MFPHFLYSLSLTLILVLLVIVVVAVYRCCFSYDRPLRSVTLDAIKWETGDVLGVAYDKMFGYFVTVWSQSIWSHTGVIWKDPITSEVYVMEAALYQAPYTGVIKIPLSRWLYINRRAMIGVTQLRGAKLDSIKLLNAYNNRAKYVQLDTYNFRWYRLLWKRPYYNTQRLDFTCYEFVTCLLQDVNVIRKLYESSSYFPGDLMGGRTDLENPYTYEAPVRIELTPENLAEISQLYHV